MENNKFDINVYCSPAMIEQQEHLSEIILNDLMPATDEYPLDKTVLRPTANFVDLMKWGAEQFGGALKDQEKLSKIINNRIIVDGQFVYYCKLKGISIKCLYRDSVVSWGTDHGFEKFFIQGVFLISTPDVEFLSFSLFHKSNQYEDEISFFVVVSASNYENYLKFRNQFDEWVMQRDRNNLFIRVVDGEDIPYTKDNSWDDLFLPADMKKDVRDLIENFLAGKDFYIKNKIPWKRGVLLFGPAGNGKTSLIKTIISNYNFKPITIVPGANDDTIREAFSYAEEQSPSLLYFEDLDSLLERNIDTSSFLNLMDGISAKNGLLVIATANDISQLKSNITDRPSRFDRKFEIPLPDVDMSFSYLKKWFGDILTKKKCQELAKHAEKYKFSYAYLKELYISAMFEALANNRKAPTEKDINQSLTKIMKDKNILKYGKQVSLDKYTK